MRNTWLGFSAIAVVLASCGGDGIGSDPGSGTQTLRVRAQADFETGLQAAGFEVSIDKAGQEVTNAEVVILSDLGRVALVHVGAGVYRGNQNGWTSDGYGLEVTVKDATGKVTDQLEGSVRVAAPVKLSAPDALQPFDPHTLPGGVLEVRWSGPAGDTLEVKSHDFKPQPFAPDPLRISIPAATFDKVDQDLEIARRTVVVLAGGAPGSSFSSEYKLKATLIVQNPF